MVSRPFIESKLEIIVVTPDNVGELSPGLEDTLQGAVSKRTSEEGVTSEQVFVFQDTEYEGTPVGEPDPLNSLTFQFEQDTFSFDQLRQARRIILGTLNEYELPANEEATFVSGAYTQVFDARS